MVHVTGGGFAFITLFHLLGSHYVVVGVLVVRDLGRHTKLVRPGNDSSRSATCGIHLEHVLCLLEQLLLLALRHDRHWRPLREMLAMNVVQTRGQRHVHGSGGPFRSPGSQSLPNYFLVLGVTLLAPNLKISYVRLI